MIIRYETPCISNIILFNFYYRSRRHHEHEAHGFEGDMTAEEIFNMFFGGTGFPSQSVYVRRGRNTAHFHRHFHNTHHHADTTVREVSNFGYFLKMK